MKAYLIDPYQRKVHSIEVERSIKAWRNLLECELVDALRDLDKLPGGRVIDVWFDDDWRGLDPLPPTFRLCNQVVGGYGLALEADPRDGKTHEASFPIQWFTGKLAFEKWEDRLDVRDYFEQLTRYLIKA